MKNFMVMAVFAALLAACGEGDPNDDEGEIEDITEGTETTEEEEEVGEGEAVVEDGTVNVGDLTGSEYDSTAGTLSVTITLDADTATTLYTPSGTLNGFDRFEQQDEPTDRFFVGLAAASADGSVEAAVAQDGGQFNRFFGGAIAIQNNYSAPSSGLASYSGGYVGLLNIGPDQPLLAGEDPSLAVGTPTEVSGTVFLNADFNDNQLNGSIFDRSGDIDGDATDEDLATVVLVVDDIAADGTFTGTAELEDLTGVGSYGGVVGGTDGSSIAGVTNFSGAEFLNGIALSGGGTLVGDAVHNEYGIFVAEQCTGGATPTTCFSSEGIDD